MCSGSEAGSYLRLTDFVYHSTLGLGVIKKKKRTRGVEPVWQAIEKSRLKVEGSDIHVWGLGFRV